MSHELTEAVQASAVVIRDLLPTVERHRPSVAAAVLVARELADRFRVDRGFVNESVEQVMASTGLSSGQVRDALGALDQLGVWVADGKGNQWRPTVRRPGPVLLATLQHRGLTRDADEDPNPGASRVDPRNSGLSTAPSIAGQPAEPSEGASRDTPGASRENGGCIAGQPATPHPRITPDVTSPTTDSSAWNRPTDAQLPPPANPDQPDQPDPPPPLDDRGSLLWATRLARTIGTHTRLTNQQLHTELLTAWTENPDRTDTELVADIEARTPA